MKASNTPVLVLGARSDIAREIATVLAKRGHPLMLAVRGADSLAADVSDMHVRHGVAVTAHDFDVLNVADHAAFFDGLPLRPGIVICAIGLLGDQEATVGDPEATRRIVETNYLAPCLAIEVAAERLAAAGGKASIVAIGSVAGDRGRARNYVYGSAKAGFAAYISGLRQKHAASTLHIMTVKPGFVRTAMTEGMDLPGLLTSDADAFAGRVVKAMDRGTLVYADLRWRIVMGIITHLPEKIFMRMKF